MYSTTNLYLKTIYQLSKKSQKIRVTDIAEKLNYTKSSVSKALKRLNNNNYIVYESYGDIILTDKALQIVEEIIKKENLLELFFIGILNIPEEQAKEDIKIISNYVSEITNSKLKEFIKKNYQQECCKKHSTTNCHTCDKELIKKRVSSNNEWLEIIKEEK